MNWTPVFHLLERGLNQKLGYYELEINLIDVLEDATSRIARLSATGPRGKTYSASSTFPHPHDEITLPLLFTTFDSLLSDIITEYQQDQPPTITEFSL